MHIGFLDLQETFPLNTKLDFDLLSLTLDIQLAFVYPSRIVRNLEYCNSSIYSTLNNQEPHQWKAISDLVHFTSYIRLLVTLSYSRYAIILRSLPSFFTSLTLISTSLCLNVSTYSPHSQYNVIILMNNLHFLTL